MTKANIKCVFFAHLQKLQMFLRKDFLHLETVVSSELQIALSVRLRGEDINLKS